MVSKTDRALVACAIMLSAVVFAPTGARAEEAGGSKACSTCQSDAFDHWYSADCCESGEYCRNVGSYPGHSAQAGWCGHHEPLCQS